MSVEPRKIYKIDFMEFDANVPDIRIFTLRPYHLPPQRQRRSAIRKFNLQGDAVINVHMFFGEDCNTTCGGVTQNHTGTVIVTAVLEPDGKTGWKPFKYPSILPLLSFHNHFNTFTMFQSPYASGNNDLNRISNRLKYSRTKCQPYNSRSVLSG